MWETFAFSSFLFPYNKTRINNNNYNNLIRCLRSFWPVRMSAHVTYFGLLLNNATPNVNYLGYTIACGRGVCINSSVNYRVNPVVYFGHYKLLAFGLGELQIFCAEAHRQPRRRNYVLFWETRAYIIPTNQVRFIVRQKRLARLFRRGFNTYML